MPGSDPPPSLSLVQFARRCLVAGGIGLGLVALFLLLWYATYVILLIFAGVLLAVLLRGLAEFVSRFTRLGEGWALTVVILGLVALLGAGIYLAYPPVSEQLGEMSDQLPAAWGHFKVQLSQYGWGRLVLDRVPAATGFGSTTQPGNVGMNPGNLLNQLLEAIIAVIVVGFTAIYLAAEPRMYTNGVLLMVPRHKRERAAVVMQSIGYTLRWWLAGQGITMVVIGMLTGFGLWLVGIKLWLLLGVLAALFNFIPNFGPLVSFIPAVLLALVQSPGKAGLVVVLYVVAQSFEGYLLTPMVQRRVVALPPAVTITVQVLMGVLSGPIGVMLAAPLAAAGMVAIRMLYVEAVLGDEVKTPERIEPVLEGAEKMTADLATREGQTTRQVENEGGEEVNG